MSDKKKNTKQKEKKRVANPVSIGRSRQGGPFYMRIRREEVQLNLFED